MPQGNALVKQNRGNIHSDTDPRNRGWCLYKGWSERISTSFPSRVNWDKFELTHGFGNACDRKSSESERVGYAFWAWKMKNNRSKVKQHQLMEGDGDQVMITTMFLQVVILDKKKILLSRNQPCDDGPDDVYGTLGGLEKEGPGLKQKRTLLDRSDLGWIGKKWDKGKLA